MVLTRDTFRSSVFKRDNYRCVICNKKAADAHHIIERRLFDDGGYYIDNGASLCSDCHIKAEQTLISCEEIREAANIKNVVLPDHLYSDMKWDKWGNSILPDGRRVKGELFNDPSVQKILKEGGVLDCFCKYVKYPRTYHLPFSSKVTKDDRVLKDISNFEGKVVIVSEKIDGENSTLYSDKIHARSIDSRNHSSRNWLKAFHANMKHNIPEEWRICGENMYAKHTIYYENLKTYFYVFSIWNEDNECLSWEDTVFWSKLLELDLVPILYYGIWDKERIETFCDNEDREGFVVRVEDSFHYKDFRKNVAKWVNPKFKDKLKEENTFNWMYRPFTINKIKE